MAKVQGAASVSRYLCVVHGVTLWRLRGTEPRCFQQHSCFSYDDSIPSDIKDSTTQLRVCDDVLPMLGIHPNNSHVAHLVFM